MSLYLSHKEPEDIFLKNFYLRETELALIGSIIDGQSNNSLQSFLITGKRGMGKSTLLRRIAIEAKNKWKDKLILVYFGNENYKLSKLFKLWEQIILQILESESDLTELWKQICNEKNYTTLLLPFLRQILKDKKKTLLLMIDNFDQFMDQLSKKEQHELREALMETPVQIIGNCLFYTEKYFKYDAPFYNFFRRINLEKLSREETLDYFKFLTQQDHTSYEEIYPKIHAKLETMHILCGGVPRVLKILYDIFFQEKIDEAIEYLKRTIEEVTPLYQDRMRQLAPLQKEIIYEMALIWDRCSANDLEPKLHQSTNIILNQLSILEDNGYIASFHLEGYERLKYFEIDERFFNIWILMSEASPYDERRVIWLTLWLESFYNAAELENELEKIMATQDMKTENRSLYLQSSLLSKKLSEFSKLKFIQNHETELPQEIIQSFKAKLSLPQTEDSKSIFEKLKTLFNEGKYFEIREMYPIEYDKYLINDKENRDLICRIFGGSFLKQENYTKSLELFEKIENKNGEDLFALAFAYHKLNNNFKAEKYYLLAIEKGQMDAKWNYALLQFFNSGYSSKEIKEYSLKIAREYLSSNENDYRKPLLSVLYLWNERIEEAKAYLSSEISNGMDDNNAEFFSEAFFYCIVFHQYSFLLKLFQDHEEIRDRFKVLYYLLLRKFKKEYPKEWQRMPSELNKPVQDLESRIKSERKRLGL